MSYTTTHFRQSDFIKEDQLKRPIILIGAGGIGSPTGLVLAKMGFTDITVFDDDAVEEHNTGAQLYGMGHIEMYKTSALHEIIKTLTGTIVVPKNETFPSDIHAIAPGTIVISGVDSMKSRQAIWDSIKANPFVSWYIDGRMSLEAIRVYVTERSDSRDRTWYEESLHSDGEGEQLQCSAQSTAYNGFYCASVIGGILSAIVRNAEVPRELIGDMAAFGLVKMR